jgi:hypothetical protein
VTAIEARCSWPIMRKLALFREEVTDTHGKISELAN